MRYLFLLAFFFSSIHLYSQRFLTYEFPQLDSIIGGTYGTAVNYLGENQNLLFDFYAPQDDPGTKRPLIIYLHGGGFNSGTRSYPSVKLLCKKMAMKGYAVANIDYRLDPNFELYNSNDNRRAMTDAMHDAKQAIRYFKANAALYKLDTNQFFIGGESAGAATAMMASFVDKQKEMSIYPMANPNDPIGSNSNSSYGNQVNGTLCLCGLLLDTTAIETPDDPPILWTHGSADPLIPIALANWIVLRAQNIDLPIQTKVYEGATHCPWYYGNPHWETYLDSTITDITTFLYPKVAPVLGTNAFEKQKLLLQTYPNPAKDYLHINFNQLFSNIEISIISTSGQVYENWNFQNKKTILLNTRNLSNGLFIIKAALDDNKMITKRIVIAGK